MLPRRPRRSTSRTGEEPRKFLRQSVDFENELIGQSKFPHQPSPRRILSDGIPSRDQKFDSIVPGEIIDDLADICVVDRLAIDLDLPITFSRPPRVVIVADIV